MSMTLKELIANLQEIQRAGSENTPVKMLTRDNDFAYDIDTIDFRTPLGEKKPVFLLEPNPFK